MLLFSFIVDIQLLFCPVVNFSTFVKFFQQLRIAFGHDLHFDVHQLQILRLSVLLHLFHLHNLLRLRFPALSFLFASFFPPPPLWVVLLSAFLSLLFELVVHSSIMDVKIFILYVHISIQPIKFGQKHLRRKEGSSATQRRGKRHLPKGEMTHYPPMPWRVFACVQPQEQQLQQQQFNPTAVSTHLHAREKRSHASMSVVSACTPPSTCTRTTSASLWRRENQDSGHTAVPSCTSHTHDTQTGSRSTQVDFIPKLTPSVSGRGQR